MENCLSWFQIYPFPWKKIRHDYAGMDYAVTTYKNLNLVTGYRPLILILNIDSIDKLDDPSYFTSYST